MTTTISDACPNCSFSPGKMIAVVKENNIEVCAVCKKPIIHAFVQEDPDITVNKENIRKVLALFKASNMDEHEENKVIVFIGALLWINKKNLLEKLDLELEAWMSIHQKMDREFTTLELMDHIREQFGIKNLP